ncbi:hypothetical protein E0H39_08165 [Rhizobium leguminosarum bv. viciae]|nr:hypothetical protein CHR56_10410 [Rhizobium leguminosarum bv. viciae]OOO42422.1 hypothetical protein BS629_32240 [Rhizobium leguminosarum bv. viciae USDA 2370]NKJ78419.1 hypothetical protein [Rhizobium leguminosarum bv. viciae]NKK13357.1 hypothetical protein [Rhizobium leguminosarum bv. viciae]NKK28303.1 hypothetical protein [Rhizobium leguminosarum bv. viciae]
MSKPDAAGDKPVIRPATQSSAGDMDLWLRMWFFKGGRSLQIGNSLVSWNRCRTIPEIGIKIMQQRQVLSVLCASEKTRGAV